METDQLATLIERARRREPAAFEALVDAYGSRLYGYLYRLTGGSGDAEDLLQDLFVRLVRMLPSYQHDGKFDGWIFRIATNLARDRARKSRRTPTSVPLDVEVHAATNYRHDAGATGPSASALADLSGPAPDVRLELHEETDALQRALAELPAAEREVIMLRHFSGMTFAEIAEAMSVPLGTALARAHRGLKKLRSIMEANE